MDRKTINWNLEAVYPSPDSDEFESDLKTVRDGLVFLRRLMTEKAAARIGGTGGTGETGGILQLLIDRLNAVRDVFETLCAYTYSKVSVDTADRKSVNALNRVEELNSLNAEVSTLFAQYVAAHEEEVQEFVEKNPDYGYVLAKVKEEAEHSMGKDMEALAADLMRNGSDCFSRLQEAVTSSACADLDCSDIENPDESRDGNPDESAEALPAGKKTVVQLRALATHPVREVRRRAFEAELKIWKEHEISLAFALNSIKGTCLELEKHRNWSSPVERSCSSSRISVRTLDALISSLEKYLPMFRHYLKTKAKLLGLEKLAWYDIVAPVGKVRGGYSYEEALKLVAEYYGKFNPEMGRFAKHAFECGWIDPLPRSGKTGGAYDIYFPKIRESRVFANFDGTYDGVSTFAHELGHAWHDRIVSTKPSLLRSYPMTLAETASIFSEFIVFRGALEKADEEQRPVILEQFVQSSCQVCVDILCRFYFEREIFERRKDGELMPSDFCSIMTDCQKKTYGDVLDYNALHPYMWAVKGHYYSTSFSFYNYPYAFGQLFALGLYSLSGKDTQSEPFYEKYNRLLSLTGQLSASDVAASVGTDIENPSFWEEGLKIIERYAGLLEAYVS